MAISKSGPAKMPIETVSSASSAIGVIHPSDSLTERGAVASARADLTNTGLVSQVVRELVRRREWERSLALLKDACAQPDAPSELWVLLAFNHAQLGQMKEAAAANQKAITLEPGRFQPYQNLAMLHLQQGKPAEAVIRRGFGGEAD